jgi:hypothetical protein
LNTKFWSTVASDLGTGRPGSGLSKYGGGKSGMLCIACGDERHDVDHCYSATADGNLSLASLAFLEVTESDKKLLNAQKEGCVLHGQSKDAIEIIRDVVARIRRNLTIADRKKNIQNKRDHKAQRMADLKNNITIKLSPVRPTKQMTIEGQMGKLRVSEEQASIKSLIAMDVIEEEDRNRFNDHLAGMRLEEVQQRDNEKETESQHEGMGLLLYHNRIFVQPKSTTAVNGVDTTGISEELLKGDTVSNKCLVFLNFAVRGVTRKDKAFVEIEKYRKWLKDTSKEIENKDRKNSGIT